MRCRLPPPLLHSPSSTDHKCEGQEAMPAIRQRGYPSTLPLLREKRKPQTNSVEILTTGSIFERRQLAGGLCIAITVVAIVACFMVSMLEAATTRLCLMFPQLALTMFPLLNGVNVHVALFFYSRHFLASTIRQCRYQ